MATYTNKQAFLGALSATLTTVLYTVPASTSAIVASIVVTNKNTTTTRNITMDCGTTGAATFLSAKPVAPSDVLVFAPLSMLTTGQTIRGGQDTGTDATAIISVVEIT